MDWFLSGLVIYSIYLVGNKNKIGWVISFIGGWLWMFYALLILNPPQYGLVVASLFNMVVSARNFYLWHMVDFNTQLKVLQDRLDKEKKDSEEYLNQSKEVNNE